MQAELIVEAGRLLFSEYGCQSECISDEAMIVVGSVDGDSSSGKAKRSSALKLAYGRRIPHAPRPHHRKIPRFNFMVILLLWTSTFNRFHTQSNQNGLLAED